MNLPGNNINTKVIVCIVNYNHNKNATVLKDMFSEFFDTIIIDSGSDSPSEYFDVKLDNVGYSGLVNESVEQALRNEKESILFICSDVIIEKEQAKQISNKINNINLNEIGVYSPSSKGQSHNHCKKQGNGLREVLFVEGFIFYTSVDILQKICPIDLNVNRLGFGIDVHKGMICIQENKKCVIDNDIEVRHEEGSGYNRDDAQKQFEEYLLKNEDLHRIWTLFVENSCNSDMTLKLIK